MKALDEASGLPERHPEQDLHRPRIRFVHTLKRKGPRSSGMRSVKFSSGCGLSGTDMVNFSLMGSASVK